MSNLPCQLQYTIDAITKLQSCVNLLSLEIESKDGPGSHVEYYERIHDQLGKLHLEIFQNEGRPPFPTGVFGMDEDVRSEDWTGIVPAIPYHG